MADDRIIARLAGGSGGSGGGGAGAGVAGAGTRPTAALRKDSALTLLDALGVIRFDHAANGGGSAGVREGAGATMTCGKAVQLWGEARRNMRGRAAAAAAAAAAGPGRAADEMAATVTFDGGWGRVGVLDQGVQEEEGHDFQSSAEFKALILGCNESLSNSLIMFVYTPARVLYVDGAHRAARGSHAGPPR